jgi:putative transposase
MDLLAKIMGVSRSGFYAWKKRDKSPRQTSKMKLVRAIEDIHTGSRKTYGSPRVFKALRALGFTVSKTRVERLMKEFGIRSKTKKKFRVTTDSKHDHPVAKNILNRDFSPTGPNMVWAGDITYVWTEEGWLFLAVLLDLFSRKVIGWAMDERMTKNLALSALHMAILNRKPNAGLIHHTDRGSQYACGQYRKILETYKMICSMSRKGNCWDNAVSESFFHSLKTELVHHETFKTREEAKAKIFEWIEVFYNRQRIHSTLNYQTPEQFDKTMIAV